MRVTTGELYRICYGEFAIGAYNVNNMEQLRGLFEGHRRAEAPFILAISRGARKYAGPELLVGMIDAITAEYPELVFSVHLDHGDEESCYDAFGSGVYPSVMIDASPEVMDENREPTRRGGGWARPRVVSV